MADWQKLIREKYKIKDKEPKKTTFKDVQDYAKTKMLKETLAKKNKTTQDSARVEELLGMPYDPVSGYIKDRKKDKKQNKPNEQQVFDQIREYEDANKVIKNKLVNIYGFDEELMAPDMELMDEEQLSKYKKDLTEDPKYGTKSQPYTAKQKVANHFLKNIEENNMRIAKLKNQFKSAPKDPLGIINE
jgi:hypothetical protein